jgi:hypothetical protein
MITIENGFKIIEYDFSGFTDLELSAILALSKKQGKPGSRFFESKITDELCERSKLRLDNIRQTSLS